MPFDRLVVFGDSLSDMGNGGRFSNGPVWVEQIAEALGAELRESKSGGHNFSVGGAQIEVGPQSLRAQVNQYLGQTLPDGTVLHVVWGGANDIFAALWQPDDLSQLNAAAVSLKGILSDLVDAGSCHVLLANVPDVGMTPEIRRQGAKVMVQARQLTQHFNDAIDDLLADFAWSSGDSLYRLDVAAMAERARKDPGSFGFTNITSPCPEAARCAEYLFWDDIHPTTVAHARLAEAAIQLVGGRGKL